MKNFAKVIQLDDEHDVLFYKGSNNDDDENAYTIVIQSQWDGITVNMELGYSSEEKRDAKFEELGEKHARFHIDTIAKQLGLLDGAE